MDSLWAKRRDGEGSVVEGDTGEQGEKYKDNSRERGGKR